ncbi:cysteine-rich receptor-like protein kinase 25 [Quercus suber]|uniref:Cysteine-rich receptor-like protein kinase 25 n=2 Tax=Quercus suber TaxID=58331 RepID=A0AAW0JHR2_QUESU|nr:cysteine-rich receptor-like protein kinase 25 [Quercus suber]
MITSFNPFSLSIVFLSILSFLNLTTPATANYLFHLCANSTFSANSLYQTGINSLLSSLSSNATRNLEFYNTTTNQNTSNPVFGLYLCRGDVTSEVCRGCVAEATKDLTTRCSRERIAVIWYDECMIRYSNESIFSTVIVSPRGSLSNTQNITNQEQFNKLVNTSMTSLASQASDVPIGVKKFGTNEVNITAFQTLYNLVQCTPDLSSTECNSCLQTAINSLPICCGGKQGGRVLFPSCNVRYELYSFYNTPEAPSPTPGLQPPPPLQLL